jgi:hypothetical protein
MHTNEHTASVGAYEFVCVCVCLYEAAVAHQQLLPVGIHYGRVCVCVRVHMCVCVCRSGRK